MGFRGRGKKEMMTIQKASKAADKSVLLIWWRPGQRRLQEQLEVIESYTGLSEAGGGCGEGEGVYGLNDIKLP